MFQTTTPLSGFAAALTLVAAPAVLSAQDNNHDSDRMVTSANDDGPGSLRDAIRLSDVDGRNIRFAPGIGDLNLATPLMFSRTTRIAGADDGSTFIQGAGLRATGDGNDTLYLTGVTLRGGEAVSGGALYIEDGAAVVAIDVEFNFNVATGDDADHGGGAVYNAGYFYAEDAVFDHNRASGTSGSGGAIFSEGDARLQVVRSRFVGNVANRAGGAVEIAGDTDDDMAAATFFEVDFDGNEAGTNPGNGGALHVTGPANADIFGGLATGNKASREGGAFWINTGKLYLDGVTATDNVASGNDAAQGGGAVFNNGGKVVVVRGTYADNMAVGSAGSGGAVLNGPGGVFEAYGATFDANTATRAGGAIEDNSGDGLGIVLAEVTATANRTGGNPGNGGALHITGAGDASLHGGTFADNYAAAEGGALWNGTGTMTIRATQIIDNEAAGPTPTMGGGGLFNAGGTVDIDGGVLFASNATTNQNGDGGAIYNGPGGKLRVANSTFRDNVTTGVGGAIEDASGASTTTELYDLVMTGNQTTGLPGCGGAVHFLDESNGLVVRCQVIDNRGTEGGGLWNGGGTLVVRNSNILRNVAFGDAAVHQGGGGLYNGAGTLEVYYSTIADNSSEGADAYGGGIKQDTKGKTVVKFSTIANNTAAFRGGAIGSKWMAEVYSSTIVGNDADDAGDAIALNIGGFDTPVSNTIFVDNGDDDGSDDDGEFFAVTGARIVSEGNNLLDDRDPAFYRAAPSDIFLGDGEDAMLGELMDNGGNTLSIVPACGSPAVGNGFKVFGPDQLGSVGDGISRAIGAVEPLDDCADDGFGGAPEIAAATAAESDGLLVYPTTVSGASVTVELGGEARYAPTVLEVVTAEGRLVRAVTVDGTLGELAVGDLATGKYFVHEVGGVGAPAYFIVAD